MLPQLLAHAYNLERKNFKCKRKRKTKKETCLTTCVCESTPPTLESQQEPLEDYIPQATMGEQVPTHQQDPHINNHDPQ